MKSESGTKISFYTLSKILVLIISLLLITIVACSKNKEIIWDDRFHPIRVNGTEKIGVMLTHDGIYNYSPYILPRKNKVAPRPKLYLGSGEIVARKTQAALLNIFNQAEILDTTDKTTAILLCRKNNIDFLVLPTIMYWVDLDTPQTGRSDKVKIKIEVLDVKNNSLLNSMVFRAHNDWDDTTQQPPEYLLSDWFSHGVKGMFYKSK